MFERGLRWFLVLVWYSKIFESLQEERSSIKGALQQRRADVARGVPGVVVSGDVRLLEMY